MKYWFIAFMVISVFSTIGSSIKKDFAGTGLIVGVVAFGFGALMAALAEINDSIKDSKQ